VRGCIRSTWERDCELLAQRALRDPHDGCACDRCMGSSSLPVPRFPFPRCSFCTGTGAQLARLRAWQLTPALPAKPTLTVPLAWHGSVRALLALDDPRLADDCPPAAAAMLGCLAAAKATCRYRASSHKAWVLASHWYSPKRPRQSQATHSPKLGPGVLCTGEDSSLSPGLWPGTPAPSPSQSWQTARTPVPVRASPGLRPGTPVPSPIQSEHQAGTPVPSPPQSLGVRIRH
jgi:hypothetical protein